MAGVAILAGLIFFIFAVGGGLYAIAIGLPEEIPDYILGAAIVGLSGALVGALVVLLL